MPDKKQWKNCNRFSEKLAQKMLQLGLNGQKLARKSDVSDSEISRIMNGKSLPGLENAAALARAVGVSLDYLADDGLDHEPNRPQETSGEMETMVLRIVRDLGLMQSFNLLENARLIGYELAMKRLIEAKPTVVAEPSRSATAPSAATPARAGTA